MRDEDYKFVSVKFEKLLELDEMSLRTFITRELTLKKITIDDPDTDEKKKREAFRVRFRGMKINAVTEATQKLPQQALEVILEDISVTGGCIGIHKSRPVTKGGTIYLTLHFCQPELSVKGEILGLRRE